jgi:hypothetical protein
MSTAILGSLRINSTRKVMTPHDGPDGSIDSLKIEKAAKERILAA